MGGQGPRNARPGWEACWGRSLSALRPAVGTWRKALGRSDSFSNRVTQSGWSGGLAPRI